MSCIVASKSLVASAWKTIAAIARRVDLVF